MPENLFKARLGRGTQFGLWLSLVDPVAAEISALAGFDWLLIDGEHAPNTSRSVLHQLQAVGACNVPALVRPVHTDAWHVKQVLDVGAQTILLPMIETREQAEHVVAATRYPPAGVRGVATTRAARWGHVEDYWAASQRELCVILQVESVKGMENLRDIASVPGADALFVGPSDLAADMGHLGDSSSSEVIDAVKDALRTIRATGKHAGVLASPDLAPGYVEAGANFVGLGVDALLLAKAARQLMDESKVAEGNAHVSSADGLTG